MRKELDDLLCAVAPKLYAQRNIPSSQTCMCWGFPSEGWFSLLLEASLSLEALDLRIQAVQVKEKFGTLRFYIGGPDDRDERVQAIVRRAERRSAVECEECGAFAKRRGSGWIRTLCDAHAPVEETYDDDEDEA
jgi:hypothetical protein